MTAVPEEVMHVAHGVATEIRRRFHPYIDFQDLISESYIWAASNPKRVEKYMALDERERNAVVATALRHRLRRLAEKAKAEAVGYSVRDVVYYSEGEIEELLPSVYDVTAWYSPPKGSEDESRTKRDPAHGGGWIASLADVADAIRHLDEDTRALLSMKYQHDMNQSTIADALGIAGSSVSERLDRAVRAIHHRLGGDRPEHQEDELPVGRRRVRSNAAAQAETGRDLNGE